MMRAICERPREVAHEFDPTKLYLGGTEPEPKNPQNPAPRPLTC